MTNFTFKLGGTMTVAGATDENWARLIALKALPSGATVELIASSPAPEMLNQRMTADESRCLDMMLEKAGLQPAPTQPQEEK